MCATARKVSSTVFCPSRRAAQIVCSWRCRVCVVFLTRLAPIPRLALVFSAIVAVQRGSLNTPGGDRKQRRRRAQSDVRDGGAIVVVVSSSRSRSLHEPRAPVDVRGVEGESDDSYHAIVPWNLTICLPAREGLEARWGLDLLLAS